MHKNKNITGDVRENKDHSSTFDENGITKYQLYQALQNIFFFQISAYNFEISDYLDLKLPCGRCYMCQSADTDSDSDSLHFAERRI